MLSQRALDRAESKMVLDTRDVPIDESYNQIAMWLASK
jgi:hypothetical protein